MDTNNSLGFNSKDLSCNYGCWPKSWKISAKDNAIEKPAEPNLDIFDRKNTLER